MTTNTYFLREENTIADMSYLDSDAARPMYDRMAEIIVENGLTSIVDVGCRTGTINRSLLAMGYADYDYYGFDTSPAPLAQAKQEFAASPRIRFAKCSWNAPYLVDGVDTLILSGVLVYVPDAHQLFDRLVDTYRPSTVIIQEATPTDDNPYHIAFTDMSFVSARATIINIDLDIPYRKRTIYHVST